MSADDVLGVCIVNQFGECMSSAGILNKQHSAVTQQLINDSMQLHKLNTSDSSSKVAPIVNVVTNNIQYLISTADSYTTCIAKKLSVQPSAIAVNAP